MMEENINVLIGRLKEVNNDDKFKKQYSEGLEEREKYAKPIVESLIKQGKGAVEPLIKVLNNYNTWSCIFGAEILGKIKDERAIIPLINALMPDGADFLREAAADALKKFGDLAYEPLKKEIDNIINNKNRELDLIFPLDIISLTKNNEVVDYLLSLKDKIDPSDMDFYCLYLGNTKDKRVLPTLEKIKEEYKHNWEVQAEIKDSLKRINGEDLFDKQEKDFEKIKESFKNFNPDKYSVNELCKTGTGIEVITDDVRESFFPLLLTIEETIFRNYKEDSSLEDLDIIKSLKNIRDNIFSENFKFDELEKEIINKIKNILLINDYSKKDVLLSVSHILNSVKRHRVEEGKKGYLNFIKKTFEDMGDDDLEEYAEGEDSLWEPGGFVQSIGSSDLSEEKMKTFHMKHDENVNYDCRKCGKKISAHNKDWHDGMCDKCFNKEVYGKDFHVEKEN